MRTTCSQRALLGVALAGALAGGCLYTDDINERPVPGIEVRTPGPYFLGQTVELDATKSIDEDKGALEARWRAYRCQADGSPPCDAFGDELVGSQNDIYQVGLPLDGDHRSIHVELRVSDRYGATRIEPDIYTIDIGNQKPSLEMQVQGRRNDDEFILQRPITLVVQSSDADGDEVSLSWELEPAVGSQSKVRRFEEVGTDIYELLPDVDGEWKVHVTADDGHDGITTHTQVIQVGEDSPPCIAVTEPEAVDEAFYIVDRADGPRRFSVLTVDDDLDPFPAVDDEGEARFSWSRKEPGQGGFAPLLGLVDNSVVIDPGHYEPGERIELRVDVLDRIDGPERELACPDEDWSCSLVAGSTCYQRRSWGVEIR